MPRIPGAWKGSMMDRPTTRTDADARGPRPDAHEAFVLPSRRAALDLCRASIGSGPILLTGDAGAGKTWLWHRLQAEAPASCLWLGVDLTPANGPGDFYRLLGRELGLGDPDSSRVEIADFLADRQADGYRRSLVIEEAHNLSADVWEEVRILANRLDRPDGFAGLLLVGQTALVRRLSTWPMAAIEARLSVRVHLGPIDADEALDLLTRLRPGHEWSRDEVEALHRDSAGNPRRLLRRVVASARPAPIEPKPVAIERRAIEPGPLAGPARPPLRVEENLIEVGWSPEDSTEPAIEDDDPALAPGEPRSPAAQAGQEAVHDHYAALQAWREWSENQGSPGVSDRPISDRRPSREDIDYEDDPPPRHLGTSPSTTSGRSSDGPGRGRP